VTVAPAGADARRKAELLRSLHHADRPVVLPNAWDAASARLFETAGFPAIATTSAGISYACGFADGERIPRRTMLAAVERIAGAVAVPVTADLEAGYGPGPAAAARTVELLVATGAVGLNLEDARGRSRRTLVPQAAQVVRVRAARESAARAGVPVVINARTDVFHFAGLPEAQLAEAIRRGNAYLEAGADSIFVPFVRDAATIGELVRGIRGPVNILAGPGSPPVAALAALGVRRVSVGSGVMRATLGLARRAAVELRERGSTDLIGEWAIPFDELQQLFAAAGPPSPGDRK
jgi:2-methylisocitrate lyase-like PEP mutase family enzyme